MRALRSSSAFDGDRFRPEGATVIYDAGTIVAVEPAAYDVPSDCPVETYAGTLLPGLIDAHVHLVSTAARAGEPGSLEASGRATADEVDSVIRQSLASQAAAGVTTVRDLGDVDFRALGHRDLPGLPRVVASGPPLTIAGGHCHFLGGVVDGDGSVERAIAERVERGVDVVKVMASGGMLTPGTDVTAPQFDDGTLREIVERSHAAGLRVLAHTHAQAAAWQAVAAGVDGLEHFTCLTAHGPETPDDLLEEIARRGIDVCPTYGFDESRMPPPELMPPNITAMLDKLGLRFLDFARSRRAQALRIRDHGIRLVSGLDAGAAPTKRHGFLWLAVTELVEGGFTIEEAVATATSVGADACGVPAGRLRAGLSADLLVLDGDLQADPTALGRPAAVVLRGQPFT